MGMTYRRLGGSDLDVSVVGLGCNNFGRKMDGARVRAVVDAALDEGVTLFDTADVYGGDLGQSETLLGEALVGRRDGVLVATKFGSVREGFTPSGAGAPGSPGYITAAVEASLRRLRTDHIDLYQMHQPDPGTPVAETLGALSGLVRAGKVRAVGHSNFAGWQIADAAWTARVGELTPFASAQNEYSLLRRGAEADVVPACVHFGLGLLPYFPLASGLLTGKYRRGEPAPAGTRLSGQRFADRLGRAPWDTIEALERFAGDRGLSILDVAIGGLAAKPAVASVIAGATTPEQVRANVAAARWTPSSEELAQVEELTQI